MKRLINNKKGFTAQNFIVSLLIFGAGIALFVLMIGSIANDYGTTQIIDETFSEEFDKFSDSTDKAGEMWDSIKSDSEGGGLSLIGTSELFFTAGFSVISLVIESVVSAGVLVWTFPTYFGMDITASIVMMTLITTILSVIIVFTIINSLRGNKL